ncbi:MAG: LysE family translocator [Thiomonas sp.]|uniref:LysE family translocator n=1 Tax=unclassified Thiomonas TaxID=2625466 RepID=UPI0004DBB126|nr:MULTISPECIES: LysE family translocator [unclassified Thiomonas]MDD4888284.1 LysE family translocator [Thiomonas sp.]CDW96455.1 Lysine exporter protein (LYSE/YGGA) [Thiomonas sp. CB2]VDY06188.1 Lysine exporter protein (LYSE/YGGA) [Thiomonas sp. Bio17B3]VDY16361.1 Putative lysine-type exporter protein (LYSE/YGGA) [Thiomonas sp. CB2]VDY16701.1 Putative lysine-type exporter protein (LYSE/YGGA) [Thiomonas sp. CB2]
MPTWTTYLIFVSFALAASFTPGPAVMLSIHNAMHFGWRRALWSSLGNVSGLLTLATLSALGLNAVLQTSALAFNLVKVAGATYLIWLGIQQWRKAGQASSQALATVSGEQRVDHHPRKLYVKGVAVALTNPKAIAFIAALFPQFLSASQPMGPQYAVLTATFMTISLLVLSLYAGLAVLTRRRLNTWFASGWPQRVSGTVFCAFGVGLLRLHRA